jgi:hypothetical protein
MPDTRCATLLGTAFCDGGRRITMMPRDMMLRDRIDAYA